MGFLLLGLKKRSFSKWQFALLIFLAVYAFLLLFDLSNMSIQWDEVIHCYGGLLLTHGQLQQYITANTFYPPVFDLVTAGYFEVAGASVFVAKLVAVTFSLLSLWVVFEIGKRMYGSKIAFISAIMLGIMPGFVWLSRMALIETMLVFFFTVSMLFFFNWLRKNRNKDLIISGVALGLGFLVKYQMLIAGLVMLVTILVSGRSYIKSKLTRFPLLILVAVAIAIPWFFIAYQIYAQRMLSEWIYALEIGNPEKLLYSGRFPTPIFYLVEMTWPYIDVHPISLFTFLLGLAGLGLFAWRRKLEDKFLIVWFLVVYVFFTLITNKQWRYVIPLFPVLAISAASIISFFYDQAKKAWQSKTIALYKRRGAKLAGTILIAFTVVALFFSCYDAYSWSARSQVYIPVKEASIYTAERLQPNESVMVVCAFNLFSKDMVGFYLQTDNKQNQVWQYPELPVDIYTPVFNTTEFINLCQEHSVKYVFLYEFGSIYPYFNTTLTLHDVAGMLYYSGRFTLVTSFGTDPRRIFVMSFE